MVILNKNLLYVENTFERLIQSNLESKICTSMNVSNKKEVENLFHSGTDNDDIILGTSNDDVLLGLGGNDIICSSPGDDTIYGGIGNDTIDRSYGNDLIYGGIGNDTTERNKGINLCHQIEQLYDCNN